MESKEFRYTGDELDFFDKAYNWKKYYVFLSHKYFESSSNVLEVGAGIGGLTKVITKKVNFKKWTCIEPDKLNFSKLKKNIKNLQNHGLFYFENSDINIFLNKAECYDVILLADVLEHIQNDKDILNNLYHHLNPGGKIIIFVPACQFLYSFFDSQIGHFRRYSLSTLSYIVPAKSRLLAAKYIDSCGFFASLFNKLFLKSSNPSLKQVLFWDRIIVRSSRFFDRLLFYKFGKNIFLTISKEI